VRDSALKDRILRKGACPKCGNGVARREKMFATHDVGYWHGLYCESCNALWDDPDNSFLLAVAKIRAPKGVS